MGDHVSPHLPAICNSDRNSVNTTPSSSSSSMCCVSFGVLPTTNLLILTTSQLYFGKIQHFKTSSSSSFTNRHSYTTRRLQLGWSVELSLFQKNDDLTSVVYYRGITLMPIAAKFCNKLRLNRIVPSIDPLLRKIQNGFRRINPATVQIFSIRLIPEEMKNSNKDVTICFVDIPCLKSSNRIVDSIRALCRNTTANIVSPNGETVSFKVKGGVLPGDTHLFCLYFF